MRIVSYNILDGGVGRADPLAEVLEAQRADVIVLVEATDDWVTRRIARRLHLDVVTAVGPIRFGKPDAVAVLSRWPILRSVNHALLHDDGPRALIEADLAVPGPEPVTVFGLHLTGRATAAAEAERVRQMKSVMAVTAELRDSRRPHLLVGDFNANAPNQRIDPGRCKPATRQAYVDNGGHLPRDVIAMLDDAGYVDTLAATAGDAAYDASTFTTHEPGQRVDYVFSYGRSAVSAWVETDRLATFASDHYPVGAEF